MNPPPIIRDYESAAWLEQASRSFWKIFVATPFQSAGTKIRSVRRHPRFDYLLVRDTILKDSIQSLPVVSETPESPATPYFRKQDRCLHFADGTASGAIPITETIIRDILDSDLVIADATGHNGGAILEAGIALALKDLRTIVVISQDKPKDLHFDLKVNRVVFYSQADPEQARRSISEAITRAASAYVEEWERRLERIRTFLTPEATRALNGYGIMLMQWEEKGKPVGLPGMFFEGMPEWFYNSRTLCNQVLQELIRARILWIHYAPGARMNPPPPVDRWAAHCTPLGKLFIEHTWNRHLIVPAEVMAHYDAVHRTEQTLLV